MPSQATEIRDLIEAEWSLTGRLSKVPLENMKEIVRFFDRAQVEGNEWVKAIVVKKINDSMDEDKSIEPTFINTTDKYEFEVRYRVVDVQEISYSEALEDVEEMAREMQRIIKTVFDPANAIGPYMTAEYRWGETDWRAGAQPELIRKLYLAFSVMESDSVEVYSGFNGMLIYDNSESQGDNPPAGQYEYTEVFQVNISEGFETIPYLTKDITNGRGVPYLSRGIFRGQFSAITQAKQSDFEGTTDDKIPNMYTMQSNPPLIGQHSKAVMLHSNTNTNTPQSTMTTKSFLKVSRVEKVSSVNDLLQYRITGDLYKPSEYIFT